MRCLYNELRHGATLSDGRYRSPETIARVSGYGLATVRFQLADLVRSGLAEARRGGGFAHGNRLTYRAAR